MNIFILNSEMVSNTEVCTDNSQMKPNQSETTKNPIERKPLNQS